MSTIENHLTSLSVSKRLREAGVSDKKSMFMWWSPAGKWELTYRRGCYGFDELQTISAFSISEILERLTNEDISKYMWKHFAKNIDGENCILRDEERNLFRNVNKLAEVLLWKIEQEKKEGK